MLSPAGKQASVKLYMFLFAEQCFETVNFECVNKGMNLLF